MHTHTLHCHNIIMQKFVLQTCRMILGLSLHLRQLAKHPKSSFCLLAHGDRDTSLCSNNRRHPSCLSPFSSTEQVLLLLDFGLSPISTKPSVPNMKSTDGLQKVQELPEVITKVGAAVRSSQTRMHTFHQILKEARNVTPPKREGVKYIQWSSFI